MGLVLLIALALVLLGRFMGVSNSAQYAVIAVLFGAVFLFQVALPEGNALREATGGSLKPWLVLFGLVSAVLAYRAGLGRLRMRHDQAVPQPTQQASQQGSFSPEELDRYARHIVLREVGGPGQKKLKAVKVLVIGAGGLGAPVLQYLAAAGVGTIGVIDDDVVDNSNLQRQVIHTDERIGMPKVFSAQAAISAQNPFVEVRPYHRRLEPETARALIEDYDLVLDGTDNFETRYLANRACVETGVPLISAAITQWEGQISLYDPTRGGPCYQCVFPQIPAEGLAPSCAEAGVMGALPGVVGAMMATEAIKWITGAGEVLRGRLLLYDALYSENRVIAVSRREDCPICGQA